MSRSIDNIVLLESNVNKLKSLIIKLKSENSKIISELNLKDESLVKKSNELKEWKEKYQSLKIANTFLGSNDKSLTKLKINNLIKELDKCILNLSP
jgi:cysteinyl-tRNA synthetase|tara:strand:+ start:2819 stop:3106 length:288 start_codon:yes stop_codon:yes gene_type:complete